MARRNVEGTNSVRPPQSIDHKQKAIRRINSRIEELSRFNPNIIEQVNGDPNVLALEVSIESALSFAFGQDTHEYRRYRRAAFLDRAPVTAKSDLNWIRDGYLGSNSNYTEIDEAKEIVLKAKAESIALLNEAIKALKEELEDLSSMSVESVEPLSREREQSDVPKYLSVNVSGSNSRVIFNSNDHSVNSVIENNIDLESLVRELALLRNTLKNSATSPTQFVAIGSIAEAEIAASEKNLDRVISSLSKLKPVSDWIIKVATDVGTRLAITSIERALN